MRAQYGHRASWPWLQREGWAAEQSPATCRHAGWVYMRGGWCVAGGGVLVSVSQVKEPGVEISNKIRHAKVTYRAMYSLLHQVVCIPGQHLHRITVIHLQYIGRAEQGTEEGTCRSTPDCCGWGCTCSVMLMPAWTPKHTYHARLQHTSQLVALPK